MNLAERFHFVNILPPISDTTGRVSAVINMEGYSHCTFVCQFGVTNADAGFITVEQCSNMTPTLHPDFAFEYYACTTVAGDVLDSGVPTRVTAATGIDVSANDNIFYVIEIDAAEMTSGYYALRITESVPGGAQLTSVLAILSGSRDARPDSPTVLS